MQERLYTGNRKLHFTQNFDIGHKKGLSQLSCSSIVLYCKVGVSLGKTAIFSTCGILKGGCILATENQIEFYSKFQHWLQKGIITARLFMHCNLLYG